MPSRSKTPRRPRKAKPPTLVRGGRLKFGGSLTSGLQIEYRFRRRYPLSEADTTVLHSHIRTIIRKNEHKYKWFFVSIQVSVRGGLYQLKFVPSADDESTWETQWVSTKVTNKAGAHGDIKDLTNDLLDDVIAFQIQNRPTWINRIRIVFINPRKERDA